jgi:hypothetical protein
MLMNDHFDAILKEIPKRESRSKLESYARLIEELLRRGRTYREIASVLCKRCGVRVSISTLHFFVRRRSKLARQQKRSKEMTLRVRDMPDPNHCEESANPRKPQAEEQEILARIAALKRRKAPSPETSEPFRYDPSEPLRIPTKSQS